MVICMIAALCAAPPAQAGRIVTGAEFWAGGGVLDADYHGEVLAAAKGGAGLRLLEVIGVGAAVQFDKDHTFALGYAGFYPLRGRFLKPFARFELGARTDLTGEAAVGWTAGIEMGEPTMNAFVAYSGITTPGSVDAFYFGFIFNSLNRRPR